MLQYSGKKIAVVIPFYNEKNSISKVIEQSLPFADFIIAVDDGSVDGSADTITVDERIFILKHSQNLGKGAALKTGFIKSIELKTDYTITLDADLQHTPELIPEFINQIGDKDIIIGNRLKNKGKMPLQRILSNSLTSMLMTLKTGQKILDSQCGYRLFKTGILNNIMTVYSGYEAESEILINASGKGYKIGFVDIPAIYSDEESKMKPVEAILGFIKVLLN